MEYDFREIEKKWIAYWKENSSYLVHEDESKEKFYVLERLQVAAGKAWHSSLLRSRRAATIHTANIFAKFRRSAHYSNLARLETRIEESNGCAGVRLRSRNAK